MGRVETYRQELSCENRPCFSRVKHPFTRKQVGIEESGQTYRAVAMLSETESMGRETNNLITTDKNSCNYEKLDEAEAYPFIG
jgi:hypothetical protein